MLSFSSGKAAHPAAPARGKQYAAMLARTQEMRAKVVEAESLVPQAMAEAFRAGNLGIMDYMRIRNVEADTKMRDTIAGPERSQEDVK